jgi:eukaryotic-like serine/threonine-protein kinase
MTEVGRGARVQSLFDEAMELPASERAHWLETACAGDDALRRELSALLTSSAAASTDILLPPLVDPRHTGRYRVGDSIGDFEILGLLGEGGMGIVYRARSAGGEAVALKVIRDGRLATREAAERFRREHSVLARLVHPNVARLIAAGMTRHKVPFFVMELVDGRNIDEFCDERSLSVSDRIALFARVCAAVAHAHEQQIVHRDLKPSNILVTPAGVPKLLDFGIAKLVIADAKDASPVTSVSQMVLTPEYASPEQLWGTTATPASDVFALGLLLYELVSGVPPYPRPGSPLARLRDLQSAPVPPSRAYRGDAPAAAIAPLDEVVLKALRYDPADRFANAADLGAALPRQGAR